MWNRPGGYQSFPSVLHVDDLGLLRFCDLCRCSHLVFRKCIPTWSLGNLKKFVHVFGSIPSAQSRRERAGCSFHAFLKMFFWLSEYAILCMPEWSFSDTLKLLHALDVDWVRLDRRDLESDSPSYDVFMVSVDIPTTLALLLEWECLRMF